VPSETHSGAQASQPSYLEVPDMSEANKELSRRFTALFNTDDPAALAAAIGEVTTADVELHAGSAGEVRGQQQFQQLIQAWRAAFPDARSTVEEQVAEGDRVVTRWTARGTHTGDFQEMAPTGKPFTLTGITIERVVDAKIAEVWVNRDDLGLLGQLGALLAPASATS
jgi:predicted ester cyclase